MQAVCFLKVFISTLTSSFFFISLFCNTGSPSKGLEQSSCRVITSLDIIIILPTYRTETLVRISEYRRYVALQGSSDPAPSSAPQQVDKLIDIASHLNRLFSSRQMALGIFLRNFQMCSSRPYKKMAYTSNVIKISFVFTDINFPGFAGDSQSTTSSTSRPINQQNSNGK